MYHLSLPSFGLNLGLLLLTSPITALSVPESSLHQPVARQDNASIDSMISDSPLLSLHRDLVQISSISEHETKVGNFLADYLEQQNFTVQRIRVPVPDDSSTQRWDLFATRDTSDNPSPKVLLTTHMDTVPPFIPYSAVHSNTSSAREDIRLRGRGTVDAKSCIAAQVTAAMDLLDSAT